MEITRVSMISGKSHTLDINVTEKQLLDWKNGVHIQNAMPNLSKEDREFIMSGITPEEWNETFKSEE